MRNTSRVVLVKANRAVCYASGGDIPIRVEIVRFAHGGGC